ncbi:DUF1287 domain-containing protein [Aestuariispira insulae]|uniref:DUF1287 domain-containing protein n=1 Tax=Aestuariispira insulae TaxID=1461337 RepID=A0A3D9HRR9_9PROT|nr:DUF1287 domain-containing protein [Aestuariispira insulae]RED52095.1 hypothetical protein DFP90_102113 [Aestuariispira insulae]
MLYIFFVTLLMLLVNALSPAKADDAFPAALAKAAMDRTDHRVIYDGSYRKIAYPNGDVPDYLGVCSDVVVRSYRALGIDLQERVHEDMSRHFSAYPNFWGLKRPDANIDHRRVPNLRVFFERHGQALTPSRHASDYRPGDIVTWNLRDRGNLPHIGIVSDQHAENGTPLIIHNIGFGPMLENMLFDYRITGHYRYGG